MIDPGSTGGRRSYILDLVDGSKLSRIYMPLGEVTAVDDLTYTNGDAVQYGVTITGYRDSGIGGSARVWETL